MFFLYMCVCVSFFFEGDMKEKKGKKKPTLRVCVIFFFWKEEKGRMGDYFILFYFIFLLLTG